MLRRVALFAALVALTAAASAALTPGTLVVVPAAARGAGAGTSVWQMDLVLINDGSASATVRLTWLERNTDNTGAAPVTVTVPAGQTLVIEDVIGTRLGRQSGAGAILVTSNRPVAATSRIYNLQSGVTFGQGFDGLSAAAAVAAGAGTTIAGLRQDAGSRSNVFAVAGPNGASFTLTGRTPAGSGLGSRTVTVPPWGAFFTSLTDFVSGSPGDVTVAAAVTAGDAWFAGSRIDEVSGDPFTLAGVIADPTLVATGEAAGTYLGSWFNQTFFSSGPATGTVTVDTATGATSVTVDLGGNVLGGSDPPAEVYSFTVGPGGGSFETTSPVFGTTTTTIDARGRFSSDAPNVPAAGIDRFTSSGVFAADQILAGYTVFFTGGGTAEGMIRLVKQ